MKHDYSSNHHASVRKELQNSSRRNPTRNPSNINRQHSTLPAGIELPLSLLVIFRRVDTMLVVIDKVEPRHDVDEGGGVAALSAGHALHVFGQLAGAVQRLSPFDFVDHLAHVELDLAPVFGEAVEPIWERYELVHHPLLAAASEKLWHS